MRSLVAPHFLAGAAEVVDTPLNRTASCQCAILWWEKFKDCSSTLKDDSLSKLYSPTQSMSLYSPFSRSIRSLSVSSFFFSLYIFIWARCSTYSATNFSGTMYLSENSPIASLSPLTSSLSSNNRLIWARGWKSSSSRHWWGLHSKRDDGSLLACHSRDMVVELEVERW